MNSFKLGLFLLVSVFAFYLYSSPVLCGEAEENLLEDVNSYRQNLSLPALKEFEKPSCLADEIADALEDQPCENANDYYQEPGGNSKIPNFKKLVKKCRININTTTDGVIMPVCVHNLDRNALLSSYTKSSHYAKYLNSSKYTRAGIGSEDDWMILILCAKTSTVTFSSSASLLANACKGHYLLLAAFIILMN